VCCKKALKFLPEMVVIVRVGYYIDTCKINFKLSRKMMILGGFVKHKANFN